MTKVTYNFDISLVIGTTLHKPLLKIPCNYQLNNN